MPAPSRGSRSPRRAVDLTVYPVEEKVGEDILQRWIATLLLPLIERYLAEKGVRALVGADQFIYFRRGDTRFRVAPDVFILPGVRPGRRVKSWKTWEEKVVPSLAVEVVSTDVDKDYIDGPPLYRELGVQELVIFDPDFEEDEPSRFRFQVWRQVKNRGLVRVTATNEDRVFSKVLGCHLVAVGSGETARLRLATGPGGETLVPTDGERADRECAARTAADERARAAEERERVAQEEISRLEALLDARRSELGNKRR